MNTHRQDNHPHENQPPEMVPPSREEQPLETMPTSEEELSEISRPPPRFKLTWQFAAGFLGWFLVNGVLWLVLSGGINLDEYEILNRLCFVLPLNLVTLIGLIWIKKTRQVAQGILAALGLNFFVSLVLGLFYNSFCLIPFFIDSP